MTVTQDKNAVPVGLVEKKLTVALMLTPKPNS